MANNWLDWAFEHDLPAGAKFVLVALANRANKKTGECWPSQKDISKDTGQSERTVVRNIQVLVNMKIIEVFERRNNAGFKSSNLYVLSDKMSHESNKPQVSKCHMKSQNLSDKCDKPQVSKCHLHIDNKLSIEPKTEPKEKNKQDLIESLIDEFKEHRKEIKFPLKPMAEKKTRNQLIEYMEKGHDPIKIINKSIQHGWRGIFEPSDKPEKKSKTINADEIMELME